MSSWRRWRQSETRLGWKTLDPKRVIVAGHTRRLAALQLGWTHAPTVTIPAKHASAYRLADNRSGEFSTWNMDVLPGELQALPTGQLEALPALDFNAIVQPQTVEGQTDPDAIPEARPTKIQRGDDPGKRDRLMKGLDVFLERDRDRELFDLVPNKENADGNPD